MADSVSASAALARLLEGNHRFATQHPSDPTVTADRRRALTAGQHPFATVLGCVDSRAPIELIFDASVGDLLTVRSAGQTLAGAPRGNVEFGVRVLGTELVAVVGHTFCGAVDAALEPERPDGPLGEVVDEVAGRLAGADPSDAPAAVRTNLTASVEAVRTLDTMRLPDGRRPVVVGLLYDLGSGEARVVDDGGLERP